MKTMWTAARIAGRRLLKRDVGDTDVALGELLTEELDAMKGLAMKLGQIVSYMGVPLPPEIERSMTRLQTGMSGMDAHETRTVVEQAFGRELEQLFEAFDLDPVAAASIGQVHRARFESREVAVKLRYPHISREFDHDLGMVDRIAGMASLASAVDGRSIVRELAARLQEECDYAREARMQASFRLAFLDDEDVEIPEVVSSRSSDCVLTSHWVEAMDFATMCETASPQHKRRVAAILARFAYRSMLNLGTIQADPHPGNYLFRSEGPVVFLDFGCVRVLPRPLINSLRRQILSVRDDDHDAFRESCVELGVVGKLRRFDFEHFFMVMEHLYRPLLHGRFHVTTQYIREGMALNGPTSPNARTMSIPPAYVWIMRLQWGLWAVLSKLDVEADYASVLDTVLAQGHLGLPAAEGPTDPDVRDLADRRRATV